MSIQNICDVVKKNNTLTAALSVVVLIAIVCLVYFVAGIGGVSAKAAAEKAVSYINETYLADSAEKAQLKDFSDFYGLNKISFSLFGQEQFIYVTRDGRYMFPAMEGVPIDMDQTSATDNPAQTCQDIPKTDSPVVEAFVVSQCPYGLQMQRIASKFLIDEPTAANNVKIRYLGSISGGKIVAMHGEGEAQENLKQICLREETDDYWKYLSCYMQADESDKCLASIGVDKLALNSCMTDPSRGLAYAQVDFNKADSLEIGGSPTLVIDGKVVDEFSFGGRTENALKEILCCASSNQPGFCSTALSTETAATMFSKTYVGVEENNGACE
ncbi:hypothetical protein KKG36_02200 [Patescibacteria group bacterium]|nr:hypothetical protein [Patescibacteria group bacterium]